MDQNVKIRNGKYSKKKRTEYRNTGSYKKKDITHRKNVSEMEGNI